MTGSVILEESPFFFVKIPPGTPEAFYRREGRRSTHIQNSVVNLNSDARQTFDNLCSPTIPVTDVTRDNVRGQQESEVRQKLQDVRTVELNAFSVEQTKDKHSLLVYENISRFDHSCKPNAHLSWSKEAAKPNGVGVTRAVENILPNAEIALVCNLEETFTDRAQHRQYYNEHDYFTCNCLPCAGDTRMTPQVQTWYDEFGARRLHSESEAAYEARLTAWYMNARVVRPEQHHLVSNAELFVHHLETEQIADLRYVAALYLLVYVTFKAPNRVKDAHAAAGKAMLAEQKVFGDSELLNAQFGKSFLQMVLDYRTG